MRLEWWLPPELEWDMSNIHFCAFLLSRYSGICSLSLKARLWFSLLVNVTLRSGQVPLRPLRSEIFSISTGFQETLFGQGRWVAQAKSGSVTFTGQGMPVLGKLLQNTIGTLNNSESLACPQRL